MICNLEREISLGEKAGKEPSFSYYPCNASSRLLIIKSVFVCDGVACVSACEKEKQAEIEFSPISTMT